jgi:WD40 repeat protein
VRRCFCLLFVRACRDACAQGPAAAPPILVLDPGGHTAIVGQVLFTPDDRELISVSGDKTIRFWDVASGEPLHTIRPPIGPGNQGFLGAAALSPDGRTLAVGGWGPEGAIGSIYLIATATGRIERVLKGHTSPVTALALAAAPGGGLLLASGSYDKTARVWDAATGECRRVLEGHTDGVFGVAWFPDATRLATASYDKTGRIWSAADGRCLRVLGGHEAEVNCVAWSPDGALVATGGFDRSIRLWGPEGAPIRSIGDLGSRVMSVTFTSDSAGLLYTWGALEGRGHGAAVLRVGTGEERVRFPGHDNTAYSGAVSPDGAVAATTGGNSHDTYLWRMTDGTTLHRLVGKGRPNYAAGWGGDGKSIAWGNTAVRGVPNDYGPLERTFALADLAVGPPPGADTWRARESRGSLSLRLAESARLEVRQGEAVAAAIAPPHRRERILSFSFVPGDRVAVGGDYGLYLFDARTGAKLREFRGHTAPVWAVAPSPDSRLLLSASGDQTLRVWDPDHDEPLLSLFIAGDDWVAWTPEGYYAASPGGEGLMGWQLDNGPEQVGTFVRAEQFHKSLYRPEVIRLAAVTGSVALALERLKEPARSVPEVIPPFVVITNPEGSGVRLIQPELTVRAKAVSAAGHPVKALRLLLDDRPYEGEKGRKPVDGAPAGVLQKTEGWFVRLEPGRHRLAVIAETDVSNGRSEEVEVIYEEQKAAAPRLYALLLGVSDYEDRMLALRYADADATMLEPVLKEKAARAFGGVEVRRLVNREATRAKFLDGLQWLKDAMKPQDVGIIYFSGHGERDDDDIFYMLTAEARRGGVAATSLDGALFKRKLGGIKGKLVVILDACHSGAVERDPGAARPLRPNASEFARELVREDAGVIMMCSSTGQEVSIEDETIGHGYFTQALTEGLSGRADLNHDGSVYLNELDNYLFERVKELSRDRQHAVTAKPASVVPFVLSKP